MRYYHVADAEYRLGDALLCRRELELEGRAPAWKWAEADESFDADVVCLFEHREDAEDFAAEYVPDGKILTIDLPEGVREAGLTMVQVAEGYPAIMTRIPAEYIR